VKAAAVLLVLAAALAVPGVAAAAVDVYFLYGEQVKPVSRPGSTAEQAVRALLAGPTATESKQGYRSYVPAGTPLRSVKVANGVATVDLGERFAQGNGARSLLARLTQLVHTLTGPEQATKVRVLVKGGTPLGLFPGAFAAGPITVDYLERPKVKPPRPPDEKPVPVTESARAVQERLVQLGYLLPGEVDGQLGPATQNAVIAFQKWQGLERDGQVGPRTRAALARATRPTPVTRGGSGRRMEVLLDRQLALAIEDNRVVRAIHVSTGKPSTPTPAGDYRVYARIARWWSVPFQEWLLWAAPFDGGIAFHQFPEVPVYAASHGCVRNTVYTARWLYEFVSVGSPVKVLASSR
jgi:peptidoglycan hydrolase-like protein with peptidoglycan-binding domain